VVERAVVGELESGRAHRTCLGSWAAGSTMRNQVDLLATVTVLGVLEQGKCPLCNTR